MSDKASGVLLHSCKGEGGYLHASMSIVGCCKLVTKIKGKGVANNVNILNAKFDHNVFSQGWREILNVRVPF